MRTRQFTTSHTELPGAKKVVEDVKVHFLRTIRCDLGHTHDLEHKLSDLSADQLAVFLRECEVNVESTSILRELTRPTTELQFDKFMHARGVWIQRRVRGSEALELSKCG